MLISQQKIISIVQCVVSNFNHLSKSIVLKNGFSLYQAFEYNLLDEKQKETAFGFLSTFILLKESFALTKDLEHYSFFLELSKTHINACYFLNKSSNRGLLSLLQNSPIFTQEDYFIEKVQLVQSKKTDEILKVRLPTRIATDLPLHMLEKQGKISLSDIEIEFFNQFYKHYSSRFYSFASFVILYAFSILDIVSFPVAEQEVLFETFNRFFEKDDAVKTFFIQVFCNIYHSKTLKENKFSRETAFTIFSSKYTFSSYKKVTSFNFLLLSEIGLILSQLSFLNQRALEKFFQRLFKGSRDIFFFFDILSFKLNHKGKSEADIEKQKLPSLSFKNIIPLPLLTIDKIDSDALRNTIYNLDLFAPDTDLYSIGNCLFDNIDLSSQSTFLADLKRKSDKRDALRTFFEERRFYKKYKSLVEKGEYLYTTPYHLLCQNDKTSDIFIKTFIKQLIPTLSFSNQIIALKENEAFIDKAYSFLCLLDKQYRKLLVDCNNATDEEMANLNHIINNAFFFDGQISPYLLTEKSRQLLSEIEKFISPLPAVYFEEKLLTFLNTLQSNYFDYKVLTREHRLIPLETYFFKKDLIKQMAKLNFPLAFLFKEYKKGRSNI